MKIVTVNVPESYVDLMSKLVGRDKLYFSRSELIRAAVRDFIKKELKIAENLIKWIPPERDDDTIVKIPNGDGSYSTMNILRRLE